MLPDLLLRIVKLTLSSKIFFENVNYLFSLVQPAKTGFTIFCDENAGQVAQSKKASSSVSGPKCLPDKENLPQVPQQKRLLQPAVPLGHVKVVENFSDSSFMETDSPVVGDSSTQEWRVPPLCEVPGETVDILSAPEYFNVSPEQSRLLLFHC